MGTQPVGDTTPDIEELQAREEFAEPQLVVPVAVQGPVRTQPLPILSGFSASRTMAPTDVPWKIAGEDLTRHRVLLWCDGGNCYVGYDEESVRSGNAARLPNGHAPIPFYATGEIWVAADSDGITTTVHGVSEHWTR